MTTEQRAFFELVRAGLWGTQADAAAFGSGTDWRRLYDCGRNQTMLGVMLDGIRTLPADARPDRLLYLQWCASVARTEDNNRKLNAEIANLFALLRTHGVEPVLLKGQGVARNYPEPLHRQCGDIDIYIGKRNYELVNGLLRTDGEETDEECLKHSAFSWHGVTVENHRVLIQMKSPADDRRLQRNIASWHGTEREVRFDLAGCRVSVPPVEFDAVFVLYHAVTHLLHGGVGLRQVCDWACLLHSNRATIDRRAVADELDALHLAKAARVFGALAVKYLGLPAEEVPVAFGPKDEATCDWLMGEIWDSGNFGRSDTDRKQRPRGYWRGKWHTFTTSLSRGRKLWRLSPREAVWIPFTMILNVIKVQLHLRFGREV